MLRRSPRRGDNGHMRGALWLCGLTACGFNVASSSDAPLPPDAPSIDAPRTSCRVVPGTPLTVRGTVGLGGGGGNHNTLKCDAGEIITGVAYDVSDGNANGQSSPSARGIRISCATLTIDAIGAHASSPRIHDVDGSGGSGWSPSTWSFPALCPVAGALSAMMAHGGTNPGTMNLFVDTSIDCTSFDKQGKPNGTTMLNIPTSTTGMGENPSSVTCPPGDQIAMLVTDTGAGLDSVAVSCAPTICQ
jgi:hypothetical protein